MFDGISLRHLEARQRWQGVVEPSPGPPACFWDRFLWLCGAPESGMPDRGWLLCEASARA